MVVRSNRDSRPVAAFLLLLFALAWPGAARAYVSPRDLPQETIRFAPSETRRCLRCHGMANFAERDSATSAVRDLHVDSLAFRGSAHALLSCRSCHADVTQYPHVFAVARPRVACGADCHATDRRGRPYSHAREARELAASAHGRGKAATNPDSPTCGTCHGAGNPHAVAPVRRQMSVTEKMALCSGCHDDRAMMLRNRVDPAAVASYRRSFHYKAIHFGARGTAVCQDCHTAHHVLAKDDSSSSIAAAHLPGTCGQEKCHPGARMNFAMSGANHLALRIQREPLLFLEERFFVLLTAGTMLALVGGIVLDVQRRLGWIHLAAALVRRLRRAGGRAAALGRGALVLSRRLLLD